MWDIGLSIAYAGTVTTLPAAATKLSTEGISWSFWIIVISLGVGTASLALSRFQNQFTEIFGHVLHKLGIGAFVAASATILATVLPAGGATFEPVQHITFSMRLATYLGLWLGALPWTVPLVAALTWMVHYVRYR